MSSTSGACDACEIWRTTRQTDKLKIASSSLYKDTMRKLLLWNLGFIKFTAGVRMHVDMTALVSSWLQSRRTYDTQSTGAIKQIHRELAVDGHTIRMSLGDGGN